VRAMRTPKDRRRRMSQVLQTRADGSIRLDECNRITLRGLTVREFYCDGIVWGISHDVLVGSCDLHDGVRLALHSGSGSQRSIVRGNRIRHSEAGIHFRGGNKAFAPHRNRFEGNRIVDSGGEKGVAIDINGETESVVILENELREARAPKSRIGILIGAETRDIRCEENQIEGFVIPIEDLHKG
jgi:hypothetical protein